MRRRTTTGQIDSVLSNELLSIKKVEVYGKTSRETETMDVDTFKDYLDFLCKSGIFADFVDWHFEMSPSKKREYIIDSGAKNPYSENIVTAYLRISDDLNVEDIERILLFEEE